MPDAARPEKLLAFIERCPTGGSSEVYTPNLSVNFAFILTGDVGLAVPSSFAPYSGRSCLSPAGRVSNGHAIKCIACLLEIFIFDRLAWLWEVHCQPTRAKVNTLGLSTLAIYPVTDSSYLRPQRMVRQLAQIHGLWKAQVQDVSNGMPFLPQSWALSSGWI